MEENMDIKINTGNPIVDAVGMINITGNVIPENWYKTIVNSKGKPNLIAINLLAEFTYWYRPTEIRDERTGDVTYKKKFAAEDFLQKSYKQICDKFNISVKQARTALKLLESLGVIKRHERTVTTEYGKLGNVQFIELIPEVLNRLTFGEERENPIDPKVNRGCSKSKEILPDEEMHPSPKVTLKETNEERPNYCEGNTYTETKTKDYQESNTTTEEVAVRELLEPFNLDDKDILSIREASKGSMQLVKDAINFVSNYRGPVTNITGLIISAIRNEYKAHDVPYQKTIRSDFGDIKKRKYDFDELLRRAKVN